MKNNPYKSFGLASAVLIASIILSACGPTAAAVTTQPPASTATQPQAVPTATQPLAATTVPTTAATQSASATMVIPATGPTGSTTGIDPLAFMQSVRKLWEDHITWTRVYIIAAVAGLPETDAAAQRLLQNQVDIGDAIKPFYGDQAGSQLTSLLKDHILGAVDVLAAAKAGDTTRFDAANKKWYDNANQIAAFLNQANPDNWSLSDMQSMMKMHLDLTLAEATARLKGDWPGDVAAYDKVHNEILQMADMLSNGIMKQFPNKFASQQVSQKAADFTLAMNKLWEDHVTWTRVYIMSVTAGLPDTNAAAGRLLQNQVDLGDAIKPYYGEDAGNQLTTLLKDHILTAVDILAAAKAGDTTKFNAANAHWYDNGNQIAAFLNKANPDNWPLSDMQSMMKMHLDLTLAEATARLNKDWSGDVVAYDKVHNEILEMAGMLSKGIMAQFPDKFK
jgi:hypothetical protein